MNIFYEYDQYLADTPLPIDLQLQRTTAPSVKLYCTVYLLRARITTVTS